MFVFNCVSSAWKIEIKELRLGTEARSSSITILDSDAG